MLPRNKATNRLTGLLFSRLESHAISDQSTTRARHNYRGLWRWLWHQLLGLIAGDHWHWLLVSAAEIRHSELQTDACRWTATDGDSLHSPYLLTAPPRRHAWPHCHYESYISHAGMHDHTVITGRIFHTQTCTTTLSLLVVYFTRRHAQPHCHYWSYTCRQVMWWVGFNVPLPFT